ncbi:hemerythrin domain-containing protein [Caenimonas sp. SL110]|uniref:hemerythrin domain-containing protein n=1 Tax=Caenimonas sp. SL110 TaxID=1450524 RepID=UPI00069F777E
MQSIKPIDPPPGQRDWSTATWPELSVHVLTRYHAAHREQLPDLIRLARLVEQAHAGHPDCPHGLADALGALSQELESHMRKEEDVLFPLVSLGQGASAGAPIMVLRSEHEQQGAALRRLAQLTHDMTAPRSACETWRGLYAGLRTFREDLIAHIHIENNIMFERCAPAVVN